MTTPTRIIVDLAAGTTTEVELAGAELDAYNTSLAEQEAARLAAEQAAQEAQEQTEETPAPADEPAQGA